MITGEIRCPHCNVVIAIIDTHRQEHPRYGVYHKHGCKYNKESKDKSHLLMDWLKN